MKFRLPEYILNEKFILNERFILTEADDSGVDTEAGELDKTEISTNELENNIKKINEYFLKIENYINLYIIAKQYIANLTKASDLFERNPDNGEVIKYLEQILNIVKNKEKIKKFKVGEDIKIDDESLARLENIINIIKETSEKTEREEIFKNKEVLTFIENIINIAKTFFKTFISNLDDKVPEYKTWAATMNHKSLKEDIINLSKEVLNIIKENGGLKSFDKDLTQKIVDNLKSTNLSDVKETLIKIKNILSERNTELEKADKEKTELNQKLSDHSTNWSTIFEKIYDLYFDYYCNKFWHISSSVSKEEFISKVTALGSLFKKDIQTLQADPKRNAPLLAVLYAIAHNFNINITNYRVIHNGFADSKLYEQKTIDKLLNNDFSLLKEKAFYDLQHDDGVVYLKAQFAVFSDLKNKKSGWNIDEDTRNSLIFRQLAKKDVLEEVEDTSTEVGGSTEHGTDKIKIKADKEKEFFEVLFLIDGTHNNKLKSIQQINNDRKDIFNLNADDVKKEVTKPVFNADAFKEALLKAYGKNEEVLKKLILAILFVLQESGKIVNCTTGLQGIIKLFNNKGITGLVEKDFTDPYKEYIETTGWQSIIKDLFKYDLSASDKINRVINEFINFYIEITKKSSGA